MMDKVSFIPSQSQKPTQCMALMHGYGADRHDMLPLAEHFREIMPETAFYALDAPEICTTNNHGRQWFPLESISETHLEEGLKKAWPLLWSRLDALLNHHQLSKKNLILAGFSQGGMIALYGAMILRWQHQMTLCFSGFLPASPPSLLEKPKREIPVAMIHGAEDPVIPITLAHRTVEKLKEIGITPSFHARESLAHAIDDEALRYACSFLSQNQKLLHAS